MAALKKRYYQKIDEEVYSAILDNGMSLSIIKKKGFLEKAAFLSTNFGALDNHFYIDCESKSYPAGFAHFLEQLHLLLSAHFLLLLILYKNKII